ncbi:hypothetical protein CYY_006038 [Polysphondylium violaceum]|uniref:Uncharacterized protein n=1 Tax=Polysphondylium violaceum TaxID=133409 RepID=A0A8J4PSW2_9MYCE|nr:hypothetical protein CYY_006038 [Polysphondylium violaceum]
MKSFGAKIKQAFSSGPSTVDLNFETARKEFAAQSEAVAKVYESLLKHDKNLQKTFTHPSSINKNIQKYFPATHPLTLYTSEVIKSIEATFHDWTTSQKTNYDYIQQYLARTKFIKDSISDRDSLLSEVEKSSNKIKQLKEKPSKDPHKLPQEQNTYNAKKESFENANYKAMAEISQFFEDKQSYFDQPLQNILLSLSGFFSGVSTNHHESSHHLTQVPPYYNPVKDLVGSQTNIPSPDNTFSGASQPSRATNPSPPPQPYQPSPVSQAPPNRPPPPQSNAGQYGAPPNRPPPPQSNAGQYGAPPNRPPPPQSNAPSQYGAPPNRPPPPQSNAPGQYGAPPNRPPPPSASAPGQYGAPPTRPVSTAPGQFNPTPNRPPPQPNSAPRKSMGPQLYPNPNAAPSRPAPPPSNGGSNLYPMQPGQYNLPVPQQQQQQQQQQYSEPNGADYYSYDQDQNNGYDYNNGSYNQQPYDQPQYNNSVQKPAEPTNQFKLPAQPKPPQFKSNNSFVNSAANNPAYQQAAMNKASDPKFQQQVGNGAKSAATNPAAQGYAKSFASNNGY